MGRGWLHLVGALLSVRGRVGLGLGVGLGVGVGVGVG